MGRRKKKRKYEIKVKKQPEEKTIALCNRCDNAHDIYERVSKPIEEMIEESIQYFKDHKERLDSMDRTFVAELEKEKEEGRIKKVSLCPNCGYWSYLCL